MAVLSVVGISKRYGSVDALSGADFVLAGGEVHALVGENGAGKSTLMQIAFGLVRPDAGTIQVRGEPVRIRSPLAAKALGLGMVHQHFTSIPTLTVEENLRLAGGGAAAGAGNGPGRNASLAARLAAGIDRSALVESLTVAEKQRLEILQALATGARILLLDEPTAVLAPAEVTDLLAQLRAFAKAGGSVVLITHKLAEVFGVADRVTVLRRGRVVLAAAPIGEQTSASLSAAMIGEGGPVGPEPAAPPAGGRTIARLPGLEIHAGDLVGIAAIEGNGQRDLLRAIVGLSAPVAGMTVEGPVSFIAEDRSTEGLVPSFTLVENVVLGLPNDPRWRSGPWLDWGAARRRTAELIEEFGIRAEGPDAAARTLSGGNQQKLVFARAVERGPALVVAENPTRGLDLSSTEFVHARLRRIAAAGAAVVFYSTDLDEVLALATRVVVMYRGATREAPVGAGRERVGEMMLGVS